MTWLQIVSVVFNVLCGIYYFYKARQANEANLMHLELAQAYIMRKWDFERSKEEAPDENSRRD